MKLTELITSNARTKVDVALITAGFDKQLVPVKKLTQRTELFRHDNDFVLKKDGVSVGYVSFNDKTAKIGDGEYYVLALIAIDTSIQKTRTAGLFIISLKGELDKPFIIGREADYGGVVSVDGMELVAAMNKSARFAVNVLDLKTGDVLPYEDGAKLGTDMTLMIENDERIFPFYHEAWKTYTFEDEL